MTEEIHCGALSWRSSSSERVPKYEGLLEVPCVGSQVLCENDLGVQGHFCLV